MEEELVEGEAEVEMAKGKGKGREGWVEEEGFEEEEAEGWKFGEWVGEDDRLLLKFRKGAAMLLSKEGSLEAPLEFEEEVEGRLKAALILDPSRSRFLSCPGRWPCPPVVEACSKLPLRPAPPPPSRFSHDSSSATADPPPRTTSSKARCEACLSSHHSWT